MPLRIEYIVNQKEGTERKERDESILTKLREMMIRKSKEYRMLFQKYNRDSK